MNRSDDQRHRLITEFFTRQPDAGIAAAVRLWQQLAAELSSVIGDSGFQALYVRGLIRAGAAFPWMLAAPLPRQFDADFVHLKTSLDQRHPEEARVASIALLNNFIDILILLIGALLTSQIVRSAWGDDAVITSKEQPNEP